MTLKSQISRAAAQRQRVMPHDDLADLLLLSPGAEGATDEWGNELQATPGTMQPAGVPMPALAARMSAEDATKAGLASTRELWKVVMNYPNAASSSGHLRVTRQSGEVIDLNLIKVEGTDITVAIGERA